MGTGEGVILPLSFCCLPFCLCHIALESYLGTVVGGRRGVVNGPAGRGGGFGFFPQGGGEALCASGGGKGTVKFQKEP